MFEPDDLKARVIVCEDDDPTRELLCENLLQDLYDPLPAATAADALRHCRYGAPDLLLADLGLPDASGLHLVRRIRAADGPGALCDPALPIIVLSGRASAEDRVRGLRAGADDYVAKPFSYQELLMRIDKRLRAEPSGPARRIEVAGLTVDLASREVRVDRREITLAAKEFALLRVLATEPRRVFTKRELLREVWGYEECGRSRTLDSHASRLRRKLDPETGRFVKNCWGVGYRLIEA